jgi:hydroxyacylglutathione hydrolase
MTIAPRAALRVLAVPAFNDNYLWLIHDGVHAAVVDPGDAAPVIAALAAHHLTLTAILLTHHHADHIGGVPALLAAAQVAVIGPRDPRIGNVSQHVAEGDRITVPGIGLALDVLEVPGHTSSHIAYRTVEAEHPWLFCGDTLFAGGCGRIFDGTADQLRHSLDRLAQLPPQTEVYCAHEYTLANLRFAAAAEPGNLAVRARIATDTATRERGEPTIPTTIALEQATNPFLRYREPAIANQLVTVGKLERGATADAAFVALRTWKNTF